MLATLVSPDQGDWSVWVPVVAFCYNTSFHSATGETPFYAVFQRDAHITTDLYRPDRVRYNVDTNYAAALAHRMQRTYTAMTSSLEEAARKREHFYNARAKPNTFLPGDVVYLKVDFFPQHLSKKLCPKYTGPYRLLKLVGPVNAEVQLINPATRKDNTPRLVHVNKLKWVPPRTCTVEPNEVSAPSAPPTGRQLRSRGPVPEQPWVMP
jgi:hypothetical protein